LHLVVAVAAVWIPLAATLTPANRADNEEAPALLGRLPAGVLWGRPRSGGCLVGVGIMAA